MIKCSWETCTNSKDGMCRAPSNIELKPFDYEEDNKELQGLHCSCYNSVSLHAKGSRTLVKCGWKTCVDNKNGECRSLSNIELDLFDYDEGNTERQGLQCSCFKYDSIWMYAKGRDVDSRAIR